MLCTVAMESISDQHYIDLVVESEQVNIPPGGRSTVKRWIREGFVSESSEVLEMGCNTGYISYHLSNYAGANVTGVDLSEESIATARKYTADNDATEFRRGDASALEFDDGSFSHVVIGGHLPWVPADQRSEHVAEAMRLVEDGGFLLVALYYYDDEPPASFVDEFNSAFDTELSPEYDEDYWSSLFADHTLSLEYKERFDVSPPSPDRKRRYAERNIGTDTDQWDEKIDLLAENGEYVRFFTAVYRKVGNDHYREYPPGGIYETDA